jgi:antitoxin VapB
MTTATTKTFKSGNSEAVRLPKDLAFGIGTELVLERSGNVLKIYPKEKKRDIQAMLEKMRSLPKPSSIQVREEIEIPEREGL